MRLLSIIHRFEKLLQVIYTHAPIRMYLCLYTDRRLFTARHTHSYMYMYTHMHTHTRPKALNMYTLRTHAHCLRRIP